MVCLQRKRACARSATAVAAWGSMSQSSSESLSMTESVRDGAAWRGWVAAVGRWASRHCHALGHRLLLAWPKNLQLAVAMSRLGRRALAVALAR